MVLNPAAILPAAENDKPPVLTIEVVAPVVLPRAKKLLVAAAAVAPEIIITPAPAAVVENPMLAAPAAEKLKLVSVSVVELVAPVVLPRANRLLTVPLAALLAEITTTPALAAVVDSPTLTMPAPERLRLPSVSTLDDVAAVVLPRATMLFPVPLAAVVAPEMITTPAPAAVVDIPIETPPAPDRDKLTSVSTVEDVAAVVLPNARMLLPVALAAVVAPETTITA